MADLLKVGSDFLQAQRDQHMTQTILYYRGPDFVSLQATIDQWTFEVDEGQGIGVLEKIVSRDFLILAADLILSGQTTLPERGDRIKETQGNTVYVYEVLAPGQEDHWVWADSYYKTLRIHTKHVDTE